MSMRYCRQKCDEVAEWLRRWTANPLGSPRVGSNPILVDLLLDYVQDTLKLFQKGTVVACFHVRMAERSKAPDSR